LPNDKQAAGLLRTGSGGPALGLSVALQIYQALLSVNYEAANFSRRTASWLST
jgi:hypothetical protein